MSVLRSGANNGWYTGEACTKLEQGIHDSNFILLIELRGQVERDNVFYLDGVAGFFYSISNFER